MFPFIDVKQEYSFNSEKYVFDRLNELTYNGFWKTVEGNFIDVEPPTFVLWYAGDMQNSGKPISTKLTVSLHKNLGGVKVVAVASSNKMIYLFFIITVILLVQELFNHFSALASLGYLLFVFGLIMWDKRMKARAFKELEKILS